MKRKWKAKMSDLKNLVDVQCSHGNWDYDPYMHGMANGMILSLSVMDGKEPQFLESPEKWLFEYKEEE